MKVADVREVLLHEGKNVPVHDLHVVDVIEHLHAGLFTLFKRRHRSQDRPGSSRDDRTRVLNAQRSA